MLHNRVFQHYLYGKPFLCIKILGKLSCTLFMKEGIKLLTVYNVGISNGLIFAQNYTVGVFIFQYFVGLP